MEFGDSSLDIMVIYYVNSPEWDDFIDTRENINYGIMSIVENNGSSFAFPSSSIYIEKTMPNNKLHAQIIPSQLTYKIRKEVLWPHIKDGVYSLDVDDKKNTFHLGTFLDEKIISIGTFVKQENNNFNCKGQYRLRAMATDGKYRKKRCKNIIFKSNRNFKKQKHQFALV